MEFLLLWADELDDWFGIVRHYAPKALGLLAAVGLFAGTGLALFAPQATLAAIGLG